MPHHLNYIIIICNVNSTFIILFILYIIFTILFLINISYNIFGDIMYVISNNYNNEIIIKNSRFITILIKIKHKEEIDKCLSDIKIKYPKADHYCYGYIIDNYKKSSDDKEPSGTAGIPILNVLEKENITNILAVVVRYFGGIKLGAGGLTRAYSKSIRDSIKNVKLIELIKGKKIEISFNHNEQNKIDYILKDCDIIDKIYNDVITYQVLVKDEIIEKLNNYNYKIIENTYIEKKS